MENQHSHQHHHNCQKIMALVAQVLDGELTREEEKQFLDELNQCSCCLDKFSIEKSFKEFLKYKIEKRSVSSECIESIRKKIQVLDPNL